jgi:magnesium-transporting ATPase (P-type)
MDISLITIIISAMVFFVVVSWYNTLYAYYKYKIICGYKKGCREEDEQLFIISRNFSIIWTLFVIGVIILIIIFHYIFGWNFSLGEKNVIHDVSDIRE